MGGHPPRLSRGGGLLWRLEWETAPGGARGGQAYGSGGDQENIRLMLVENSRFLTPLSMELIVVMSAWDYLVQVPVLISHPSEYPQN